MKPICLALLLCLLSPLAAEDRPEQSEEYRIGVMVKAVAAAIANPGEPKSLETIVDYGTLTPYYVMIRGWLVQELQGTESQWQATKDEALKRQHGEKVEFLRQAIRRIDLE